MRKRGVKLASTGIMMNAIVEQIERRAAPDLRNSGIAGWRPK